MSTNAVTSSDALALPFTDVEITDSINVLPPAFGQLTASGMFPPEPLPTTLFSVTLENGILTALPVTNDGPATVARHGTANERIFRVPKIEHMDDVKASDIRSMIQLASRSRNPETLANLFARRLLTLRKKFDITREVMMTSAIKGVIIDGAKKTIYDLFAAFELTKKVVYFNFSDANADIEGTCGLIYDLIIQDLSDETMTQPIARVSSQFFNALISHPKVEKFWQNTAAFNGLANLVRGEDGAYRPRQFEFGSILFIESAAVAPMWGIGSQRLIAQGMGHAYPGGTVDSHVTYVAPPEDIRVLDGSAADVEDLIHVTTEPMKHGKGVEMMGQMNALPFWRRPNVLVELHAEAGTSTALAA